MGKLMKEIHLTQGYKTVVDDEDYELLMQYSWSFHQGYAKSYVNKKHTGMHRFLMNTPLGKETDHINGNRLDNRRQNLRVVTNSQNQMNKRAHGKHPFKGVYYHRVNNRWVAEIGTVNKRAYLGSFKSARTAALAYDLWAKDLFKKFAKTNFNVVLHS